MTKPTDTSPNRRMAFDHQTTAGHQVTLKKALTTAGHASNLKPAQAAAKPANSSNSGKSGGKTAK